MNRTTSRVHADGHDDKVVLADEGGTFSLIERYQLFRQGVETVKDAGGTYVKGIGEILNLAGDQVEASAGATVRIDAGLNAQVPTGMPYYAKLSAVIGGRVSSQDRLVITDTAQVTVQNGKVLVGGVEIGEITDDGTGVNGLTVTLSEQATPARVQELLRALSYKNIATGSVVTDPRYVNIVLEDAGGSATAATVDVKISTQIAAPTVTVPGSAVGLVADTGFIAPFAKVTVRDIDSLSVPVTITFDPTKGRLILGEGNNGTYDPAAGTYTVTGDSYDITDDLRALLFDPRDRKDPVGTIEETTFTIAATDASGLSSETKTVTVKAETANRSPGKPVLSNSVVTEMAADGTAIGTVSGSDPNQGDTVIYALVGAEDAPFRLVTQGGVTQLVVTSGIKLDYEQRKDYTFTLRATDARGLSNDTVVSIRVDDVNPESTVGSNSNDVIKGGAGKDKLSGGLGDDKLFGGLGNDTLTGNAGRDIFVFNTKTSKNTNVDTIKDFSVKDDSIWLDNAVFTKVGKGSEGKPGNLAKSMFWKGKAAHDSSDRIVYDKATGALYYDADGTGRAAQVKIATLKKGLALTEKDFFVI